MNLPKDFLIKMEKMLQGEYEDFLHSFYEERNYGLRINTLKISVDEFVNKSPFALKNVPWAKDGFYYEPEDRPGKHPYHEAGLYYIQEPSAMAVVEIMDPKPGEKILDVAAAPGGKTSHIAAKMNQEGLLVSNEINPSRARILSQNVERMGIKNAVVTNESSHRLAERFPSFFDRVLLDAPCSGEGMFRKDPAACEEWSLESVGQCAIRQLDILKEASKVVKPGGMLVYSTCTFSPEENEETISEFLKTAQTFILEDVHVYEGFTKGRNDWLNKASNSKTRELEKTIRIWPHLVKGEGHFIAVLRKVDGEQPPKLRTVETIKNEKEIVDYVRFAKDTLKDTPKGNLILFGDQLYSVPEQMIEMKNLKVIRPGWHLGTNKKKRFEPSHALALALRKEHVNYTWDLVSDSNEIKAYLKGEALKADGSKGWNVVTVDGFSIGWGKLVNQTLKNHYPKGLRWLGID